MKFVTVIIEKLKCTNVHEVIDNFQSLNMKWNFYFETEYFLTGRRKNITKIRKTGQ